MTSQELAAAGAKRIRETGWWNGIPLDLDDDESPPSYCLWTSMKSIKVEMARDSGLWDGAGMLEAEKLVATRLGWELDNWENESAYGYITRWNDAPGRTPAEVLAALDAVAAS